MPTSRMANHSPRSAISWRSAPKVRPNSGRAVGTAASEVTTCWRIAIAGAVMSAIAREVRSGAGAVGAGRCLALARQPVAHGRIVEQVDEFAHLRRRDVGSPRLLRAQAAGGSEQQGKEEQCSGERDTGKLIDVPRLRPWHGAVLISTVGRLHPRRVRRMRVAIRQSRLSRCGKPS